MYVWSLNFLGLTNCNFLIIIWIKTYLILFQQIWTELWELPLKFPIPTGWEFSIMQGIYVYRTPDAGLSTKAETLKGLLRKMKGGRKGKNFRSWLQTILVLFDNTVFSNWYKTLIKLCKNSYIRNMADDHWWKFWSWDTDGATWPDTALPLVQYVYLSYI